MEDKKYMKVEFPKPSGNSTIIMSSVETLTEEEMAFDRVLGIKHRLNQACIDTENLAIKVTPREYCFLSRHNSHVQGRIMGKVAGISIVVEDTK